MFKCITKNCPAKNQCLCEKPITDCPYVKETTWMKVKTYICSEICEYCSIKMKDIIGLSHDEIICHTLYCDENKEELN